MSDPSSVGLAWRVLRSEGASAFRDRLLDRLAWNRRRRRFPTVAEDAPADGLEAPGLAEVGILGVLSTPPRPELGGVQVQLLRRLEAEGEERPWALLYPHAGAYRLEIATPDRRCSVVLKTPPPAPESLADPGFVWAVRRACRRAGARAVHFEQLVGWPLESVGELGESGLRQVLSVHDFGLFCLRPHLLERPALAFCDFCRDDARCLACLRQDWPVDAGFQSRRRRLARDLLERAEAVVFPSDYLRRSYRELMPAGEPERQRVVEPPSAERGSRIVAPARREIRHVAYVGSVKAHKGALAFAELVEGWRRQSHRQLRFSVYGGGDAELLDHLRALGGVRIRGYYRADDLPRRLRRDRVDLALLLSIWPEAYALTFDECLRAGVPAMAFDHGAVGDRARRTGGGLLVPPAAGTEGLAAKLEEAVSRGLPAVGGEAALPDAAAAARAMLGIYRELDLVPGGAQGST